MPLSRELRKLLWHVAQRQNVIDLNVLDHALGHRCVQRFAGILHEDDPAPVLDSDRAGGSVIQCAAEDERDRVASGDGCRASKQRIDRGPVPVLARPPHQAQFFAVIDQQVTVGRSDVNDAAIVAFAVLGMFCPEPPSAHDEFRKSAGNFGRNVNRDEDRSGKIWREVAGDSEERLDSPGRA